MAVGKSTVLYRLQCLRQNQTAHWRPLAFFLIGCHIRMHIISCTFKSIIRNIFYRHTTNTDAPSKTAQQTETPNDQIEQAIRSLNQHLAEELLEAIMAKDAAFFEELVVKLLRKMGYGGSLSDAGFVTQRSNDGGIDGIIREDKLGFDKIYIQAKRWDPGASVSRPEIQKFSGALRDEGAAKGLFITTARFSEGARVSAEKQHIVLVDGERLTRLMIEYNIGVSPVARYEIKSLDSDFFDDAD